MSSLDIISALELGLVFSLVGLGVYLSYKVLQFPDLTVDGSFPLGAAVGASLISSGYDPAFSIVCSGLSGFLAGAFTGWLNRQFLIKDILSSIITMSALYSINMRIMGGPNISLFGERTIFSVFHDFFGTESVPGVSAFLLLAIIVLLFFGLTYLLSTEIGLSLRTMGMNEGFARSNGINVKHMTMFGIGISNGIVAVSGNIFCQLVGVADVGMGIGIIIAGLAAVVIGDAFSRSTLFMYSLISAVVGSICYRFFVSLALNLGSASGGVLEASDLNAITAALLVLFLVANRVRSTVAVGR